AFLYPAHPPTDLRGRGCGPAGLAVERPLVAGFEEDDLAYAELDGAAEGQLQLAEAGQELGLFDRADLERADQPEIIDMSACAFIAGFERGHGVAHADQTGAPRQLLIDRDIGNAYRIAQTHVLLPFLHGLRLAAVGQHFIDIAHRGRGEADQAVRNLEG